MFTSEEISKAREIAAKATPRPWRAGFLHDIRRGGTRHELHEYDVVALAHSCLVKNMTETFALVEADIAYLELACNEYPAALDEIERLRKALEVYANAENWQEHLVDGDEWLHGSGAETARAALQGGE